MRRNLVLGSARFAGSIPHETEFRGHDFDFAPKRFDLLGLIHHDAIEFLDGALQVGKERFEIDQSLFWRALFRGHGLRRPGGGKWAIGIAPNALDANPKLDRWPGRVPLRRPRLCALCWGL